MALDEKGRIRWIDIAKALVIVLVVFGHTMRSGFGQRMVYGFHVPAFFFLAGMTCRTDRPARRIRMDFLRIMVPYYGFGLLSIGVFAVLGKFAASRFGMDIDTSLTANLWGLVYANAAGRNMQFNAPLWFLPSLFLTKLLYYGIHRLCRGKTGAVAAVTVVLGAAGFFLTALDLTGLPFSFSVTLKMLPFFAFGRVFLQRAQAKPVSRPAALWVGIGLLAAACVIGFLAPKVNYTSDEFPHIPAFLTTAISGSAGICLLSMGISRSRLLEYVGKDTLAILVMHKFPVLLFQTVGPFGELLERVDTMAGNLAGLAVALAAIAMSLAVAVVVKRWFPFLLGIWKTKEGPVKIT